MVATSGAKLLEDDALDALRTRLLPLADIATPNIPEAELLAGTRIVDAAFAMESMRTLRAMGAKALLLRAGISTKATRSSIGTTTATIAGLSTNVCRSKRTAPAASLASAVAANLCLDLSMPDAARAASDYVERALRLGYRPGRSDIVVLDHFGAAPPMRR